MNSARISSYGSSTPIPASIITTNPNSNRAKTLGLHSSTLSARKSRHNSLSLTTCKANSASSSNSVMDLDLYDLLGIDSSSDQSQIKLAYRALQKRCHPDIAGPAGHDMAIILNETYSVLSDPNSRFAYDKEQSKFADLRGYTGKPLYSAWFGQESEQRAVFVDEVKCIGCLKCALLAENTFAIESAYGRARVVAQWADSENKIQEAIEACPVDCILMVERSNLAALEFLMSKQPRGNVRVGAGNTVGTRVSNIFVDVEKFQSRFQDSKGTTSTGKSTESESERQAKNSAVQAIRSISNWMYWQSPIAVGRSSESGQYLTYSGKKPAEPNIKKLQEAAAARKLGREYATKPFSRIPSNYLYNDAYWIPSTLGLPQATPNTPSSEAASKPAHTTDVYKTDDDRVVVTTVRQGKPRNPLVRVIPIAAATVAAVVIHLQVQEGSSGTLEEHAGGSFALHIVNSSWSQVILAAITWYLIGIYMVEIVEALVSKMGMYKK